MVIVVPDGVQSGQQFQFRLPDGVVVQTTVPAGVQAGSSLVVDVQMPSTPAAPVAGVVSVQVDGPSPPVANAVPAEETAIVASAAPVGRTAGVGRAARFSKEQFAAATEAGPPRPRAEFGSDDEWHAYQEQWSA